MLAIAVATLALASSPKLTFIRTEEDGFRPTTVIWTTVSGRTVKRHKVPVENDGQHRWNRSNSLGGRLQKNVFVAEVYRGDQLGLLLVYRSGRQEFVPTRDRLSAIHVLPDQRSVVVYRWDDKEKRELSQVRTLSPGLPAVTDWRIGFQYFWPSKISLCSADYEEFRTYVPTSAPKGLGAEDKRFLQLMEVRNSFVKTDPYAAWKLYGMSGVVSVSPHARFWFEALIRIFQFGGQSQPQINYRSDMMFSSQGAVWQWKLHVPILFPFFASDDQFVFQLSEDTFMGKPGQGKTYKPGYYVLDTRHWKVTRIVIPASVMKSKDVEEGVLVDYQP